MSKTWPLPFWIAHRGAGKLAPENTLAAFRVGAQHGYRAFECDVKLSRDGQPFLLHDDTLNRTTRERGIAGERAWAELSRIDAGAWHSRAFAGEMLPSLEAIAQFCLANGHALNIEIKPTTGRELETGQVVGREVLRLWPELPVVFSSFKPEALIGVAETAPELPRALLLDALKPGWLDQARGLGCAGIVANYTLMDRATIDTIHLAGMKAAVYTVNDEASAQWLIGNGIDGIITDAVDRFSAGAVPSSG
ncbi:glycerophosphodiester phosphodiesterase [Pelomonas sp. KK5]|uniref:glycerophosphodiester phosphodiesterase n=1 Tax=Pelomonas sp. KK5 TaxID=1855730 RepID=UPI00097C00AD|nr:glycerophosphodiester phosphodiesterase [Pelomonas sp. KK5]